MIASLIFLFYMTTEDYRVPALWNAPLAEMTEKLSVIIFSHGLGGCRTAYSKICLDIASRGIMVAAVEHRYC